MFNEYPYRNLTDLNLDYIFKIMKEVEQQVEYFVSLNAIKYADPIQWDITRQYEKNTIVIDPLTGTAYISVAPVPSGTALTRPEYWTVVFDLQRFVTKACKNFTTRYEAETTTTATFNTPANGWLCWADVLYKANVNITAGDSYVPGGNITAFTMEDFGGHLDDLLTTDKTNIVAAINELFSMATYIMTDIIGDLNDLTTVDKTSIVNAINELVTDLSNAINTINLTIGDLATLTTTDKTSIVNAINEVDTNADNAAADAAAVDTKVGDLADLTTTDKSSIVNAINDITSIIPPGVDYITPDMYGAAADGVTDDATSIVSAMAECASTGKTFVLLAGKTYLCGTELTFTNLNYDIIMDGTLKYLGSNSAITIDGCEDHTLKFNILGDPAESNTSIGLNIVNMKRNVVYIVDIANFHICVNLNGVTTGVGYNTFYLGYIRNHHIGLQITRSSGWVNENLFVKGKFTCNTTSPYTTANEKGIVITGGYYHSNNVFIQPCLESVNEAIILDYATRNTFTECRFENVNIGVTINNESKENYVTYTDHPTTAFINNNNWTNEVIPVLLKINRAMFFDSGNISAYSYSGANKDYAGEYIYTMYNNADIVPTGMTKYNGYVKDLIPFVTIKGITGRIGVCTHCSSTYNICCKIYDSSNNELTNVEVGTSDLNGFGHYYVNRFSGNNVWELGTNLTSGSIKWLTPPPGAVTMKIGIRTPSNSEIYDLKLYADDTYVYNSSAGYFFEMPYVKAQTLTRGIESIPTCEGVVGDYARNAGSDPTIAGWYYDGTNWNVDYINGTP